MRTGDGSVGGALLPPFRVAPTKTEFWKLRREDRGESGLNFETTSEDAFVFLSVHGVDDVDELSST